MVGYVMPSYWAERERERVVAASAGTPLLNRKGEPKGGKVNLPEGGIQSSSLLPAAVKSRQAGKPEPLFGQVSNLLRNPDFHPAGRPSPYHPSTVPGAAPGETNQIDPNTLYSAIKDYRASSAARGDVPEGFEPVGHGPAGASLGQVSSNKGEGPASYGTFAWMADAHERTRREEVRVRKIEGRGPPKKGEGRRSQMKRK